jgi:nitrogenase molybdenum-iron protein NifN
MISHYKEPVDIASTNFSEEAAIFGGEKNLEVALTNLIQQYNPDVIAIASTCLSETIGDDLSKMIKEYKHKYQSFELPHLLFVSTASYRGTHMDGFHHAVFQLVKAFALKNEPMEHVNIFPGFVSPEDLRWLKEIFSDFGLSYIMVPDYSETLDNPGWNEYKRMPEGGTSVKQISQTAAAKASIEFGRVLEKTNHSAAKYLEDEFGAERYAMGLPIGIKETDIFLNALTHITGKSMPEKYAIQRGRLIDAYIDGHKYIFGKKAVVYGEEDLVIGLVSFLEEIGIEVVLCASGGKSRMMNKILAEDIKINSNAEVLEGGDFEEIAERCRNLKPDIMIGNSKGYYISRELNIPLIRLGFPIHDRVGGQHIAHLGYKGAQDLFDKVTNAIIEQKQNSSPVGYKYM